MPADEAKSSAEGGTSSVDDRYRSLFTVGRGGMGSVEVALERGTAGFERVVALKRLLPGASKEKRNVEMFLREARLAALLSHPNVVHAFDFGELRGELYLAMEYVEGASLAEVIARAREIESTTRLSPTNAAYVLAAICDGLHAAHELRDVGGKSLNVVHRDVSPHNVMISYEGAVKLLDFGVAKIDADAGVTKTGEVKGKTAYMSPEQAMGEPLDRRSDLYSVGAVLFECVTGQKMWGDGTDLETLRKLALEEPPPMTRALADAPPALVDLHARLVAKRKDDRPANAREVARELRAYIASTRVAPDVATIRALMATLFRDEAAARRDQLAAALHRAAPDQEDALRASLVPNVPAPTKATRAPRSRVPIVIAAAVAMGGLAWGARSIGAGGTRVAPENTAPGQTTAVSTRIDAASTRIDTAPTRIDAAPTRIGTFPKPIAAPTARIAPPSPKSSASTSLPPIDENPLP